MKATLSTAGRQPSRLVRDVLGVFKLRIGLMIMLTALVGLAFTPGPALDWGQVLVLAFAVFVSSASAGAFSQYVEADSDRLMARTRGPAFVTGALPHRPAWLVLIAALLALSVGAAGGRSTSGPRFTPSSVPSPTPWCTRSGSSGAPG